MLSTMLQHNGVRLWLAGHEHDQVLQKVHYIYSLQAGVLRNEQDVHSSVIFWFRAIWLRSKRLPFGAMRIGNDLEMSGVL